MAILDDVRHTRRRAQVVLQHAPGAGGVADQIDAGDVDAHATRRLEAAQHRPVARGPEDHLGWDQPRREDLLIAVDVVEEHRQRAQALLQPALELAEVVGGDDPRQQAERKDLLGAARIAVDRERHALLE
jgi:hypothetical protein